MLTQGSEAVRSGSTEIVRATARGAVGVLAQQAPAGGVAMQMCCPADGSDLTVAEQDPDIAVLRGKRITIGGSHQGSADFNAEMVPVGITFGQTQQASPTGATDVEVDRLIRNPE